MGHTASTHSSAGTWIVATIGYGDKCRTEEILKGFRDARGSEARTEPQGERGP